MLLFVTTLELTGSPTQYTSTASCVDLLLLVRSTVDSKERDTCTPSPDLVVELPGNATTVFLSDVIDKCVAIAAYVMM